MNETMLKSPTQMLKQRFRGLRNQLTALGVAYSFWSERILEEFPEHGATNRLYNVWYGRVADLEITERTAEILEDVLLNQEN